mmetsp:Transcript_20241/g.35370  ORF Transcript_20241/g.35370 Transcript_20241/m.35370 type:complete len:93 (-) Transcript_20241:1612-1890(-)
MDSLALLEVDDRERKGVKLERASRQEARRVSRLSLPRQAGCCLPSLVALSPHHASQARLHRYEVDRPPSSPRFRASETTETRACVRACVCAY